VAFTKKKTFDFIFGNKGAERRISSLAFAILVLTVLATGTVIFAMVAQQLWAELKNGLVRTLNDRVALFQHEIDGGIHIADGIANRQPHLSRMMAAINDGAADEKIRHEIGAALDTVRPNMKVSG